MRVAGFGRHHCHPRDSFSTIASTIVCTRSYAIAKDALCQQGVSNRPIVRSGHHVHSRLEEMEWHRHQNLRGLTKHQTDPYISEPRMYQEDRCHGDRMVAGGMHWRGIGQLHLCVEGILGCIGEPKMLLLWRVVATVFTHASLPGTNTTLAKTTCPNLSLLHGAFYVFQMGFPGLPVIV